MIRIRCTSCGILRQRECVRNKTGRPYYYTGGKIWRSANICYECHKSDLKKHMKAMRKRHKEQVELEHALYAHVPEYHKTRRCPECNGKLELNRYFACYICKPELPEDDDYFNGTLNFHTSRVSMHYKAIIPIKPEVKHV